MNLGTSLALMLSGVAALHCADLKPETAAAFDRYVKLTEAGFETRKAAGHFLWLDQNAKQKTLVWLGQSQVVPQETLDRGEKIEVPDGAIQHWLGAIYLEYGSLDRVCDTLVGYDSYKYFFKDQVVESRLVKQDGDKYDGSLRLYKKQITQILLNMDLSAQLTAVGPMRAAIASRSTHISEAQRSGKKNLNDRDTPAADQNGYLWRLNMYWRLEQADVGVYAELELISLSRAVGGLHAGRFLNGFQNFPRELTEGFLEGLRQAFPKPH